MKEFKSKVGYGILIPVLILCFGITFLPIINGAPIRATLTIIGIMVLTIAFILHVFFQTTYRINDKNELLIKCGFLYNAVVKISSIKSINRTRNPISSPAASLDRIELKYGKWDSVIISPNDRAGFVNELLKINPNIQHNLK
ncbi:PH domain-containing protein [Reichenbachiella agariperforans]|uniref:PH domain-containing protein n=1 Tax=Reichenbachiella agariperforans TaxID=156994 RepID=UPI001C082139|nr:PH domain-containing protein [Reichenbachiella agariperforans]MBU2912475.1 PH domain-containing protein [Reichenbachiella agariperforans]